MDVIERVKQIASTLSGVPVADIDDNAPLDERLPDGLDLDSLDRLELAMELEESFGIEIPDSDTDRMIPTPVGVASYLRERGVTSYGGHHEG